ncbi:hypothetical protein V6B11_007905 [Vibrio anguillarum]|uniref:hypothetical protein n=1 Tax=Vibrio anguillarum TaxID=55601 RepID=UPI00097E3E94|nr:hypothetical protein [Vibrio anguillarum]MBT2911833.1 hypothetical protein [Vibrio anguillarum]MBT2944074.1 hypothetical protein [Vibrio anguillarum]MBT2951559.1 hypothetical protein [Vibrio anguillarum]
MDNITLTLSDIDVITQLFFIYAFLGVLLALLAYDLLSFGFSLFMRRIKRKRLNDFLEISDK